MRVAQSCENHAPTIHPSSLLQNRSTPVSELLYEHYAEAMLYELSPREANDNLNFRRDRKDQASDRSAEAEKVPKRVRLRI